MAGPAVRTKGPAGVAGGDRRARFMVSPGFNSVTYRGYPVQELCRRHSFEEVAYLLWHGELPTREQLSAQNRMERGQRALPPEIAMTIADQPFDADPMDTLRTVVELLGADDPAQHTAAESVQAEALRLFAVLPSVIAFDHRRRHGLGAVAPRDHLSYAANFLYMTFGKVPEPQVVAAFDISLILYAGHSVSAAVPAARAATADVPGIYGAVAGAVGALKGPPFGGAGEAVMTMMNEIGIPDNAKPWLGEALADGRKIMGFGQRFGKGADPRVAAMRTALGMIAAHRGGRDLLEVYDALASAVDEETGLCPDLDYPAGPAWHLIGFDSPAFTPVCAAACLPGWTADVIRRLAVGKPIGPVSTSR